MNRPPFLYRLFVIGVLTLGLTGCALERRNGGAGNIDDFVPPVSAAQTNTIISLQPATPQIEIGNTTTVEIRIENIANLFGAEIQVQFNPNILQVQDVDSVQQGIQIQPGNIPTSDFIIENEADNATGDIFYAVTQQAPTPPASGSGTLATITFRGIAAGSSQLTFNVVKLSTAESDPIPATAQPGQITVGQPTGQVTPTPTATTVPGQPTDTPTATSIPGSPTFTPTPTFTLTPGLDTPTPTATAVPISPTPPPTPTPTYTPLPPMTDIPPGATIGFCYRVQSGETIYSLAQKFATTPYAINLVNDLYPPNRLLIHQALFIPETLGHGPNVYVTQPGDTLASIGERCKLPASMIARVNKLDPDANVSEGQTLIIPIPPFPPPSRYQYPTGLLPIVPYPPPPPCCNYARPPYRPGPPLYR